MASGILPGDSLHGLNVLCGHALTTTDARRKRRRPKALALNQLDLPRPKRKKGQRAIDMRGPTRAYYRDLSRLVREVSKDIRESFGTRLPDWTKEVREESKRLDALASSDQVDDEIEAEATRLLAKYRSPLMLALYRGSADDAANRTEKLNKLQVGGQLRLLGVNVLRESPQLEGTIRRFTRRNTELIVTIPQQLIEDSVRVIEAGVLSGKRHEVIARELFKITKEGEQGSSSLRKALNRAKLIARDQTLSFSGELTKHRHRANGVREFVWNTVGDGRVRDLHEPRNGKTYNWNDGAPGGEPFPGSGVNCRCFAEPVL